MLNIVGMNRTGLNNEDLKVKFEFEFNEDSVLPEKSCSVGQKTYLIANGSTAKNITTNKFYEYKDGKWIKVVTTSENETTTKSNKITDNGDYNIPNNDSTGFNDVSVDVSTEPPVLIEKSITENGEYTASSDNADGYSRVDVDVSGGGTEFSSATGRFATIRYTSGNYVGSSSIIWFLKSTNGVYTIDLPTSNKPTYIVFLDPVTKLTINNIKANHVNIPDLYFTAASDDMSLYYDDTRTSISGSPDRIYTGRSYVVQGTWTQAGPGNWSFTPHTCEITTAPSLTLEP